MLKTLIEMEIVNRSKKEIILKSELNPMGSSTYDYETLKEACSVEYTDKPVKPQTLLKIATKNKDADGNPYFAEYFSVGDISAIVGRSGNGKGNLTALIIAEMLNNRHPDLFQSQLKKTDKILVIDTEQSEYDVWRLTEKIVTMTGDDYQDVLSRLVIKKTEPLTPAFRLRFIKDLIEDYRPVLVVIDGVADVLDSINDEGEAKKVVSELRGYAREYKVHLVGIIHSSDKQKGSTEAMGWVGTVWKHKAEGQMNVTYEKHRGLFKVVYHKARHGFPGDWAFEFDAKLKCPVIPDQASLGPDAAVVREKYLGEITTDVDACYGFWISVFAAHKAKHGTGAKMNKTTACELMQEVFCDKADILKAPSLKEMKGTVYDAAVALLVIRNIGGKNSSNLQLLSVHSRVDIDV